MRTHTAPATDAFLASLRQVGPDQVAAVYAVGSLALSDFSERQSNIDLVVVSDPALDRAQLARLARPLRALSHAGRPAEVWHVTWGDLDAGGPGSGSGIEDQTRSRLATPMTRAILRHDPMALTGPDWPVVAHDPEALKTWCSQRLHALATGRRGALLLRRVISPLVLEAARLAQGAINGRVLSKTEAGESITQVVSSRHRRVLTDSVGYRGGAQTSMYWGPFERRSHALDLIRDLDEAAASTAS